RIYSEMTGSLYVSGNENAPTAQLATIQIMDRIGSSIQRIDRRMQGHLALSGQGHELSQVIIGADQVANEVNLGRDNIDRGDSELATIADNVVATSTAQHSNPVLDSASLTDKVNHCLGTLPIRDVFDFRNLAPINYDCMIST